MLKLLWLHILIVLNCEHTVLKSNSLSSNPVFSPSCSALYFPNAPEISGEKARHFSQSDSPVYAPVEAPVYKAGSNVQW